MTEAADASTGPRPGFNVRRVNTALEGTVFQNKLHHFERVASTQELALEAAKAGADAGYVCIADEQTAGRGRGGHLWHSEAGTGLYLSALARPSLRAEKSLLLSLAAGLAAQTAIRETHGAEVDLRWPNDLVTHGSGSRKLGGILTESAMQPDGMLRYAVIGIGINVSQNAMPGGLHETSVSLRMLNGAFPAREELASALLRGLAAELEALQTRPSRILGRFADASTWVCGKRVHVAEGEGYTGTTNGMDASGLLRVRCDDGTSRTVLRGGVRELPPMSNQYN